MFDIRFSANLTIMYHISIDFAGSMRLTDVTIKLISSRQDRAERHDF